MNYAELRERTNASLSGACRHGVAADMALAVLILLDQIEPLTAERDAAIARAERPTYYVSEMATPSGARDVLRWDEQTESYANVGLLVDDDWIDAEVAKATAEVTARAERAEAELGECKRWIGDVMEAMDNEFMSVQMAPVFIGAMAEMQKEYVPEMQALRARAEVAEALAASRPEITVEAAAMWAEAVDIAPWRDPSLEARDAWESVMDALHAHAAKVSR